MVDHPAKTAAVRQLIKREFHKNREVVDQEEIRGLKMRYYMIDLALRGPSPIISSTLSRISTISKKTRPSTKLTKKKECPMRVTNKAKHNKNLDYSQQFHHFATHSPLVRLYSMNILPIYEEGPFAGVRLRGDLPTLAADDHSFGESIFRGSGDAAGFQMSQRVQDGAYQ